MVSGLSKVAVGAYDIGAYGVSKAANGVDGALYYGSMVLTSNVNNAAAALIKAPACIRHAGSFVKGLCSIPTLSKAPVEFAKWAAGINNFSDAKAALKDKSESRLEAYIIPEPTPKAAIRRVAVADERPMSERIGMAVKEGAIGLAKLGATSAAAGAMAVGGYYCGPAAIEGVCTLVPPALNGAAALVASGTGKSVSMLVSGASYVAENGLINTCAQGVSAAAIGSGVYLAADQYVKLRDADSAPKIVKHAVLTGLGAASTYVGLTGGLQGQYQWAKNMCSDAMWASEKTATALDALATSAGEHPVAAAATTAAVVAGGCLYKAYANAKKAMDLPDVGNKVVHGLWAMGQAAAAVGTAYLAYSYTS